MYLKSVNQFVDRVFRTKDGLSGMYIQAYLLSGGGPDKQGMDV